MAEFNKRFTKNVDILLEISNSAQMQLEDLESLKKLGLSLPTNHEMLTAKTYIQKQRDDWKNKEENNEKRFSILSTLYEMREVFPDVYSPYAAIDTFECSTAVCENSFSALAQIRHDYQ